MRLESSEWKRFSLGRLFDIRKGRRLTAADQEDGENLYIGAIDSNNGVANHIGQVPIHEGNTITLSYNGSVGEAFYQPEPYWATDDVNALYPRFDGFNKYIGLFMATTIRQEKYRFSYGRKWTLDNMKITDICLPIQRNVDGSPVIDASCKWSDDGFIPGWQLMEDYIKSLHHKPLTTKNKASQVPQLKVPEWKEFRFGDFISAIYKARAINKDDLTLAEDDSDSIRYITRTADDNGCELHAVKSELPANIIENGNAISIGDTTATCFYQDEDFITGDHMVVVRADSWLNKYTGLFIVAILQGEQYKYSYGRAYLMDRIRDTIVKLPADAEGNPDWLFMENYIKALPYGDRLCGTA